MIGALRQRLASPQLPSQLRELAANATAAAPVSLTLDLGQCATDWLTTLPAGAPCWYQARTAADDYQLGICQAF